jgi:dTDP-4-dehydrorhamnose reductase
MTKILITGSRGFLGSNLVHFLSTNKKYEIFSTSRTGNSEGQKNERFVRGDLLDRAFVDNVISTIKPDIVINTVSLVNVDLCEEKPALAEKIIVDTARNLAESLSKQDCRFIQISTDQLFDGQKMMYSEDDLPAPVNVYGTMKLKAENTVRHLVPGAAIIRTNFFGWSPRYHPPTFAEWIFNSLRDKTPITLFTDLYFCPIEVSYLIEALDLVMVSEFGGIINIVGSKRCSKFEFGMALARKFGFDTSTITPSKMQPDSFKARRQGDLSLSIKKYEQLFGQKTPGLEDSLSRFYRNRNIKSYFE